MKVYDSVKKVELEVADAKAEKGGNVTSVHHERANEGSDVNGCYLRIVLETRNYEHIQQIRQGLLPSLQPI